MTSTFSFQGFRTGLFKSCKSGESPLMQQFKCSKSMTCKNVMSKGIRRKQG